jgi:hypothetical protein
LDAIWVWKSTSWSHAWISSEKISAKSVTNTVKDFTKVLWLLKSGTKAIGTPLRWQTIAGHWRVMYLITNTGEIHTPFHFRGKFLPVSWARKRLFCTFNSSVSLKISWEKSSVNISESSIKCTAKLIYWGSWHKKAICRISWDKKDTFCSSVLCICMYFYQ